MTDVNGNKVYGVGGSAESGLFGATINSTVGQLRLEYPAVKEDFGTLYELVNFVADKQKEVVQRAVS